MALAPLPNPPAWSNVLRLFEIDQSGNPLSPKTVSARLSAVRKFARAMPVPPERLNREHVQSYMANYSQSAVDTYNTTLQHIRSFLQFAQAGGFLERDLVSMLPKNRRRLANLTRSAPQSVVENALANPNPRVRMMVVLSAMVGLKPGEIARLHYDQLEPDPDGEYRLIARQTSGRSREVLLRPDLASMILDHGPGYVFPGRLQGHISPAYVSKLVSRALPNGISATQLKRAFEASRIRLTWAIDNSAHAPVESVALAESAFHPWVWSAARALWIDGHRWQAVQAACANLNKELQGKLGRRDLSDSRLIEQAYSSEPPEPGKARLRPQGYDGSKTAESLRIGALQFGKGCFLAIRNPTSHELGDMDRQLGLEHLASLSLLARWIDDASVLSDR